MMMLLRRRGIAASFHVCTRIGFKLGSAVLGAEVVDLSCMDGGFSLRCLHVHVTDGIDNLVGRRSEWPVMGGRVVPIGARVGVTMPVSHDVRVAAKAHHHDEKARPEQK